MMTDTAASHCDKVSKNVKKKPLLNKEHELQSIGSVIFIDPWILSGLNRIVFVGHSPPHHTQQADDLQACNAMPKWILMKSAICKVYKGNWFFTWHCCQVVDIYVSNRVYAILLFVLLSV